MVVVVDNTLFCLPPRGYCTTGDTDGSKRINTTSSPLTPADADGRPTEWHRGNALAQRVFISRTKSRNNIIIICNHHDWRHTIDPQKSAGQEGDGTLCTLSCYLYIQSAGYRKSRWWLCTPQTHLATEASGLLDFRHKTILHESIRVLSFLHSVICDGTDMQNVCALIDYVCIGRRNDDGLLSEWRHTMMIDWGRPPVMATGPEVHLSFSVEHSLVYILCSCVLV